MYYNLTQFAIVLSLPLTASLVDALDDRRRAIVRRMRRAWSDHQARAAAFRELDALGHLSEHVLRDIGAPESLRADAAARRRAAALRWSGLEGELRL